MNRFGAQALALLCFSFIPLFAALAMFWSWL